MLRAVAGHPPGANLAAIGDELAQQVGVLVVDVGDLLVAEGADLLLRLANRWLGHVSCSRSWQSSSGKRGLERRLVGKFAAAAARRRRGPRVVGRTAGGRLPTAVAATAALAAVDL